MAPYLAVFFAVQLLVFSLSHAARPRLWADFFVAMERTGYAPIIIPLYTMPIGLILILGHNLWTWDWRVFVTIAGWGMMTKCVIYLLFPRVPTRMIAKADRWTDRLGGFRLVGVLGAVLGVFLTWKSLGSLTVV